VTLVTDSIGFCVAAIKRSVCAGIGRDYPTVSWLSVPGVEYHIQVTGTAAVDSGGFVLEMQQSTVFDPKGNNTLAPFINGAF
jgi:hypothetical protein